MSVILVKKFKKSKNKSFSELYHAVKKKQESPRHEEKKKEKNKKFHSRVFQRPRKSKPFSFFF